ncbi:MAG: hypothetical protein HKN74_05185 [Acidimicrobiia bacterium]|nr:DUF2007 domain-containing protein [Acidimicrobiia bacterium]NNF09661.1 hypothetical protein [Acidimicrobiia bacterium]NNL68758.1 hypothetical protein [Acidimicrobiia bacterium]
MQSGQFVTVGMFPSRPEAHVSRARLESEGLEAIVSSDDAGGYEPQLGLTNGVRLMVRAPYVALAMSILEPIDGPHSLSSRPWVSMVALTLATLLIALIGMPVVVTVLRALT